MASMARKHYIITQLHAKMQSVIAANIPGCTDEQAFDAALAIIKEIAFDGFSIVFNPPKESDVQS
jgi:hypothetical protein